MNNNSKVLIDQFKQIINYWALAKVPGFRKVPRKVPGFRKVPAPEDGSGARDHRDRGAGVGVGILMGVP